MATVFSSVADNAVAQIATALGFNNTTTPLTISVVTGQGVRFGTINATGMFVTIWDKTTYPDPLSDPNAEKATITAITADSLTIARPSAVAHTGTPYIGNLWRTTHYNQLATAVNTLEGATAQKQVFDAVVATSGGDYTTVGAALLAGAGSIFVRRGTFTETTSAMNTWTAGTKDIHIVGEDRDKTIIQLFDAATGYFSVKSAGAIVENLTILPGATYGVAATFWVSLDNSNITLRNCTIPLLGNSSGTGNAVYLNSGYINNRIDGCKISSNVSSGGSCLAVGTQTYGAVVNNTQFVMTDCLGITEGGAGSEGLTVTNSYFVGNGTVRSNPAIFLFGTTHNVNHSIVNNTFVMNSSYALQAPVIKINTGTSSLDSGTSVTGNTITCSGSYYGIIIDFSYGATYSNNRITRSGSTDSGGIIQMTNNATNNVISSNVVSYTGASVTNLAGIAVQGNNNVIFGNVVKGLNGTTNVGTWTRFGATNVVYGNLYISCTVNEIVSANAGAAFSTQGAISPPIRSSTAAVTIYGSDSTILVDTTGGVLTATLPTAVGHSHIHTIKCIGASVATVATTSAQTIDGATTYALSALNKYVTVQSNGTNWYVIANN